MSLLRTRGRIGTLGLLVPVLLAFALGACVRAGAPASSGSAAPERSLTVVGEGLVREAPDIARTTLGVEATAPSAVAATRDAATRIAAVIAAVKGLGVEDRDVQTSAFTIRSERFNTPAPAAGSPPGLTPLTYVASSSVSVTIRGTARASEILDAAVSAGANEVWGVSFAHSDEEALRTRARALAVTDARARAEGLARAAGVALGAVLSIDEVGLQPFGRVMAQGSAARRDVDAIPIENGELTISDRIQIVFAIEPAT
jgi:uncharacterized protein